MILCQLFIVLALIFIGARVGGIGLGIYGMVGVFILVFIFGLQPGKIPIDVMLIIASVITATAALQAAGGLDYLVGLAAKFLRKHPTHITYYGPLTTWLFCLVAGTAHTSYSLLPIIAEIAKNSKIRPERPMTVATISASLGITGSPMSAATAAVISTDLLGGKGIELKDILLVCIPASLIAILVSAFVQNRVGKELEDDPEYQRRVREGMIDPEAEAKVMSEIEQNPNPRAKWSVLAFLLGVVLVVIFGSVPSLRPTYEADGVVTRLSMPETIEILMMSIAALILIVGKASVKEAVSGNIFDAGMNAMIAIFGIAWMGDTFFNGNIDFFKSHIADIVTVYHEYHAFLTGCCCAHPLPVGYRSGHPAIGTRGYVSCREWLFLHSKLSDGGGCYQLRHYRHNAYRQICAQPLVPTLWLYHNLCQHLHRLSYYHIYMLTIDTTNMCLQSHRTPHGIL